MSAVVLRLGGRSCLCSHWWREPRLTCSNTSWSPCSSLAGQYAISSRMCGWVILHKLASSLSRSPARETPTSWRTVTLVRFHSFDVIVVEEAMRKEGKFLMGRSSEWAMAGTLGLEEELEGVFSCDFRPFLSRVFGSLLRRLLMLLRADWPLQIPEVRKSGNTRGQNLR